MRLRSKLWSPLVAAAAVVVLSSCGGSMPDMSDLQQQVSERVSDLNLDTPDNVSCSAALSLSAGATGLCELIYEDQRNRSVEVNIKRVGSDGIGFDMDLVDDR